MPFHPSATFKAMGVGLGLGLALAASAQAADFTLVPFNGLNGQTPSSAPICVPSNSQFPGEIGKAWCFGTTYLGGKMNAGTLYRIKPDGTRHEVLFSFDIQHGLTPSQQPAVSPNRRHLYGVTSQGGENGSGLIYDFDLLSRSITVLNSFSGPVGTTSQAPPILVGNTLYGVTGQSGAKGFGTIWAQAIPQPQAPTPPIQLLHSFAGSDQDVATPFGALTYNPTDKLLYGMAFRGGAAGLGGVFSLALDGSNYTLRASFTQATGGLPQMGALLLASDGKMYGNTWLLGPGGEGTLFRFDPTTNQLKVIYSYAPATGMQPYSQLAESPSRGWLYSVASKGGANQVGSVLAIKKDGSAAKVLTNFDMKTTGGFSSSGASVGAGDFILLGVSGGSANHVGSLLSLPIPANIR